MILIRGKNDFFISAISLRKVYFIRVQRGYVNMVITNFFFLYLPFFDYLSLFFFCVPFSKIVFLVQSIFKACEKYFRLNILLKSYGG